MNISMQRYMTGLCVFMIPICVLMWTIDVIKDGFTLNSAAFWALVIVELLGMLVLVKETVKQNKRSTTKMRSPISYWLLFAILVTASIGSRYFVFANSEPKDISGFAQSASIATLQWCILFFIFYLGRPKNRNTTPSAG